MKIGEVSKFETGISRFKNILEDKGYKGPAVVFLICRVGGDEREAQKLQKLNENAAIKEMVLYSGDQLDSKLKALHDNIEQYTGWVSTSEFQCMSYE